MFFYLGNFTYERIKETEQFTIKTTEQLEALQNVLVSASNIYWKCDPETHVKDKTYLEVTQFLQVNFMKLYKNEKLIFNFYNLLILGLYRK